MPQREFLWTPHFQNRSWLTLGPSHMEHTHEAARGQASIPINSIMGILPRWRLCAPPRFLTFCRIKLSQLGMKYQGWTPARGYWFRNQIEQFAAQNRHGITSFIHHAGCANIELHIGQAWVTMDVPCVYHGLIFGVRDMLVWCLDKHLFALHLFTMLDVLTLNCISDKLGQWWTFRVSTMSSSLAQLGIC